MSNEEQTDRIRLLCKASIATNGFSKAEQTALHVNQPSIPDLLDD